MGVTPGWLSLQWLSKDAVLLFAARALRSLAYGFLTVLLPIHLSRIGFSPVQVGLVLTLGLGGGAAMNLFSGVLGDRLGRRRMLLVYAVLMALAGTLLAATESYLWLIVAAFIGTLGAGGDGGGFVALEQAILPQRVPTQRRTDGFAVFNALSSVALALGALMAGIPVILERWGLSAEASFRSMFIVFIALALLTVFTYLRLSARVDLEEPESETARPLHLSSRAIIARLALLFGVGGFAGGIILQSFVSYWLFLKFGLAVETLACVFFVAGLLSGLSFFAATWLSKRIGLINTMVFTHIPASLLLVAFPFAPTAAFALVLYLVRTALSQMDVPTRQSYTMAVVRPEDRTAAAGATVISRNLARIGSPSLAGYLVQAVSLSSPFIVSGGVKTAYCLALYWMFRGIKPPEETKAQPRAPGEAQSRDGEGL